MLQGVICAWSGTPAVQELNATETQIFCRVLGALPSNCMLRAAAGQQADCKTDCNCNEEEQVGNAVGKGADEAGPHGGGAIADYPCRYAVAQASTF